MNATAEDALDQIRKILGMMDRDAHGWDEVLTTKERSTLVSLAGINPVNAHLSWCRISESNQSMIRRVAHAAANWAQYF